jgi:hypothetical protein
LSRTGLKTVIVLSYVWKVSVRVDTHVVSAVKGITNAVSGRNDVYTSGLHKHCQPSHFC